MRLRNIIPIQVICFIVAFGPPAANALWPQEGLGVAVGAYAQGYTTAVPDGAGGAIVVWHGDGIRAQRVDGYGNAQWAAGGVPVCSASGLPFYINAAADGSGGLIVAWGDNRAGNVDVYAQRLDRQGNRLWAFDGVALCTAPANQFPRGIASDGSGGAIVAWEDKRAGSVASDPYIGRVNAAGIAQWTADGVLITAAVGQQYLPRLASDGQGGAVVTWEDAGNASGNRFVYAQRFNNAGAKMWAWVPDGLPIRAQVGQNAQMPEIASLGDGIAVIAWFDTRGPIYAQKLTRDGNTLWAADGLAVCASASAGSPRLRLAADGTSGGTLVAWANAYWSASPGVHVQRLNSQGVETWSGCGVATGTLGQGFYDLSLASDGAGGALVTWADDRETPYYGNAVYAQRVNASGFTAWTQDGIRLSRMTGGWGPTAVNDGAGGGIFAWSDNQVDNGDVMAQRVERNGNWGYPAPAIVGVRDVPGDQGGRVNIAWQASRLDPWPFEQVYQYSVWRAISPTAAKATMATGSGGFLTDDCGKDALVTGAVRLQQSGGATLYWQLIDVVSTAGLAGYSDVVPTLSDSTAVANERHHFQVMAHSYFGNWPSLPDSGYSVDNLAPAGPAPFSGRYFGSSTVLHWGPVSAPDLASYHLYRGDTPDFAPGPASFVVAKPDTGYTDQVAGNHHYKLCAADIHGNLSPYVTLAPGQTSPVPVAGTDILRLHQNVPNPFNPQTTIAFDLPAPGRVSLRVYDVAGRLVRNLVDSEMESGRHELVWDGRDAHGRSAGSGSYLARIEANGRSDVVRMGLVR